jgi:hypothetical protein
MGGQFDSSAMNENRDAETGQYARQYDHAVFLDALRAHGGAAGTAEVADCIGCPNRTAYFNLNQLRDKGRVTGRQIGQAMLWIMADEEADT